MFGGLYLRTLTGAEFNPKNPWPSPSRGWLEADGNNKSLLATISVGTHFCLLPLHPTSLPTRKPPYSCFKRPHFLLDTNTNYGVFTTESPSISAPHWWALHSTQSKFKATLSTIREPPPSKPTLPRLHLTYSSCPLPAVCLRAWSLEHHLGNHFCFL